MNLYPQVVLVAGGKGGVGKSTICSLLARNAARMGRHVGVLDLDISGPSQNLLFKCGKLKAKDGWILPNISDGVQVVSLGSIVEAETALVWSPLAIKGTIKSLLAKLKWSKIDLLFVDMPPGSGEIHLFIADMFPKSEVVHVTTSSDLALADCRREMSFFSMKGINSMGIIENMSTMYCCKCGAEQRLFDVLALDDLIASVSVPLIARVPFSNLVTQMSMVAPATEYIIQKSKIF